MGTSEQLTPKKRRAIACLMTARTVEDAAEQAQVSRRTLFTWMTEPNFLVELRKAEGAAISEAVRALIADLRANHETLRALRDNTDESSSVRLRAAVELDNSLLRWRELFNVEDRIAALEDAVFINDQQRRTRARIGGIRK